MPEKTYNIEDKMTESEFKKWKEDYEKGSSKEQEDFRNDWEDGCKECKLNTFSLENIFLATDFESDSYKNGKTDTYGYRACCDILGKCGMSVSLLRIFS